MNWNSVCGATQELPWRNIWSADNPVNVFKLLVSAVWTLCPTTVVGMSNKDNPWFDDQCRREFGLQHRLIYGGPVIAPWLTGKSMSAGKGELMKPTRMPSVSLVSGVRNRDVLINAQSLHNWWSTLKSAVFMSSSSFPPLVGGGYGMLYE